MIYEKGKVTFGEAFKDYFKGYVNFTGRSTRAGYWWMQLVLGLLWFVAGLWLIFSMIGMLTNMPIMTRTHGEYDFTGAAGVFGGFTASILILLLLLLVFALGLFLPTLALQFRRLRDAGLRGRGTLVFIIFNYAATGAIYSSMYWQGVAYGSQLGGDELAPTMTFMGPNFFLTFLTLAVALFIFVVTVLPSDAMTTTSDNAFVRFFIRHVDDDGVNGALPTNPQPEAPYAQVPPTQPVPPVEPAQPVQPTATPTETAGPDDTETPADPTLTMPKQTPEAPDNPDDEPTDDSNNEPPTPS